MIRKTSYRPDLMTGQVRLVELLGEEKIRIQRQQRFGPASSRILHSVQMKSTFGGLTALVTTSI